MTRISQVRQGLWAVESSLDDFDVRAAVLAGATRSVIWDALGHPRDLAGVAELAEGLPITLVYSHGDWDHVFGASGLARAPNEVIGHVACASRFRQELPRTLREMRQDRYDPREAIVLSPPTRLIKERLQLDLGSITLELHPLPGHTSDSIVGWVPEWGVLLAGDAVEAPIPFLNPDSPLELWIQGLEGWVHRLRDWVGQVTETRATENRATGGLPPAPASEAPPTPLVLPAHGPLSSTDLLLSNVSYLRALAEGREPLVPTGLTPFYRDTHAANLRNALKSS